MQRYLVSILSFSPMTRPRFLINLTDIEADTANASPEALAVAHRLEGLPLRFTQMAGLINRKDCTIDEFLRQYEERKFAELHRQRAKWPAVVLREKPRGKNMTPSVVQNNCLRDDAREIWSNMIFTTTLAEKAVVDPRKMRPQSWVTELVFSSSFFCPQK